MKKPFEQLPDPPDTVTARALADAVDAMVLSWKDTMSIGSISTTNNGISNGDLTATQIKLMQDSINSHMDKYILQTFHSGTVPGKIPYPMKPARPRILDASIDWTVLPRGFVERHGYEIARKWAEEKNPDVLYFDLHSVSMPDVRMTRPGAALRHQVYPLALRVTVHYTNGPRDKDTGQYERFFDHIAICPHSVNDMTLLVDYCITSGVDMTLA